MSKPKNKFYVVWNGRERGVFSNWSDCKAQIDGYAGAQYKGFPSKEEAEEAYKHPFAKYRNNKKSTSASSAQSKKNVGKPILNSICVDAACSGNPGDMEFQGVDTQSGAQLFHRGPYQEGTNNIGEFLAIVLGLAYLRQQKKTIPIYTDSRTAMSWVRKKKCNTKLEQTPRNRELFKAIRNAEEWLQKHPVSNQILKWETEVWGEIPADFGRK
jgi:ribonuclease HI